METTVYCQCDSYERFQIEAIAQYTRFHVKFLDVNNLKDSSTEKNGIFFHKQFSPILNSSCGPVIGLEPIVRYIAGFHPELNLNGSDFYHKGLVDSSLSVSAKLYNIYSAKIDCNKVFHDSLDSIKEILNSLNDHLEKFTYLVGESVTLADIFFSILVSFLMKNSDLADYISSKLLSIQRHHDTITHQPCIEIVFKNINKNSIPEPTSSFHKQEVTSVIEDEETVASRELDQLPPCGLNLDEWKREISNSKDILNSSMKWFWSHFDVKGWSLFSIVYEKSIGDCLVEIAVVNQLGGFVHRLHPHLRRHSFGVFAVLDKGSENCYEIKGVMMFRGKDLPTLMKLHPSYEFHTFRKLNVDNDDDRKLITDYFRCSRGEVEVLEGRRVCRIMTYK